MTHSTLLTIGGGALVTCVLAAFVFGSGSSEDKRLRQERKLLRALEAQRRSRDARRLREERRHPAAVATPSPMPVEPGTEEKSEDAEAERRAAERQRKREEKEQAAARKAEEAERRTAERQRKRREKEEADARKAEEAERRTAERERKRREKEEAAARKAAERHTEELPLEHEPEVTHEVEVEKPLAELPLYSWANRIENEDGAPTDPD